MEHPQNTWVVETSIRPSRMSLRKQEEREEELKKGKQVGEREEGEEERRKRLREVVEEEGKQLNIQLLVLLRTVRW